MLAFLRSLFRSRRYGPGHPIFDSRQLVTESELRQWKSRKVIVEVERTRTAGNPLESSIFPPIERRDQDWAP